MSKATKFYTYMWLREDGTPYYVGKGSNQRAYRDGSPDISRIVIQEWPDQSTAFENEKRLIMLYGRKDLGTGILNNRTDGGDGLAGLIRTKEHEEKIMAHLRGRPLTEEHRRKISESMMGEKNPAFGKKRLDVSATNTLTKKGKIMSDETRAKMSASAKGRKLSEETRAKLRGPRGPYNYKRKDAQSS
jgi:hypothetical protein